MQNPNIEDVVSLLKPPEPLKFDPSKIVKVNTAIDIIDAIEDAEEGTTIIIAKGHYLMPRDCILTTHNVVIKGETGIREDVILDSDMEFDDVTTKFKTRIGAPAIIKITHARNVTIADLTLANNPKYGILFLGDGNVQDLTVWNVKFHNIWARGLKGTGVDRFDDKSPDENQKATITDKRREHVRPKGGLVRHCLFVTDHVKRNDKDQFDGDYIAGMDLMGLLDWEISENAFIGIRGKNGGARGGVFIWCRSENVLVENNIFVNCDKGIALGNPSGQNNSPYHIKNSIVRNNYISGGTNKAIEIDFGDSNEIYDNHIFSKERLDYSSIQVLNTIQNSVVKNNNIHDSGNEVFNVCEKVSLEANEVEDFEKRFNDILFSSLD